MPGQNNSQTDQISSPFVCQRYHRCQYRIAKYGAILEIYKGQHTCGITALSEPADLATKLEDKVEILSKQFQSIFTTENTSQQPTLDMPYMSDKPPIVISAHGIEQLLRSIQSHKAFGPDTIRARLLKECATNIAPISANIFRRSLKTGDVSADWRDANISPVFKKGKPDDLPPDISDLHCNQATGAHCPQVYHELPGIPRPLIKLTTRLQKRMFLRDQTSFSHPGPGLLRHYHPKLQ